MHPAADAVADIFPHDAVAAALCVFLNGMGNIAETITLPRKLESLKEALLCYADQIHGFVGHLPARVGAGAVAMKAADVCTHVHTDNITLMHPKTFKIACVVSSTVG